MRLSEEIKLALTAREVVERYGYKPNAAGFIKCPFHEGDHHGSLKIYPASRGWHCFGCGEGSSVIDFAVKLFGCSPVEAMARLNTDFGLGLTDECESPTERSARVIAAEAAKRELDAYHREYDRRVYEFRDLWLSKMEGYDHPDYSKACKKLDGLQHWFEVHPWR